MGIYIFVPVIAFYGYHQLGFMEDRMLKHQRRMTTVEQIEVTRMADEARKIGREVEEEQLRRKLKDHESKNAQS